MIIGEVQVIKFVNLECEIIFEAESKVPLRGIRGLFSPLRDSGGRENEIDLTQPLQKRGANHFSNDY
jgi:hypothetical protein